MKKIIIFLYIFIEKLFNYFYISFTFYYLQNKFEKMLILLKYISLAKFIIIIYINIY